MNPQAFSDQLVAVQPLALGIIRRLLIDQSVAEDVYQEAALAAWGYVERDGEPRLFKPWFLTICRRRSYRMFWMQVRDRDIHVQVRSRPERAPSSPAEWYDACELYDRLVDVSTANGHSRELIALFASGHSTREIATQLRCGTSWVNMQRRLLQKAID